MLGVNLANLRDSKSPKGKSKYHLHKAAIIVHEQLDNGWSAGELRLPLFILSHGFLVSPCLSPSVMSPIIHKLEAFEDRECLSVLGLYRT